MTYLPAEAKARIDIDSQLEVAGWVVQDRDDLDLYASQGVAVREFTLKEGHGRVDYLLFIDRQAAGTIEAKPAGTTLTEVELQIWAGRKRFSAVACRCLVEGARVSRTPS